jgi:hypothetical protein
MTEEQQLFNRACCPDALLLRSYALDLREALSKREALANDGFGRRGQVLTIRTFGALCIWPSERCFRRPRCSRNLLEQWPSGRSDQSPEDD